MPNFPDFAQTSRLGFQAGREQAEGSNPLGQFIRNMLSSYQQRKMQDREYAMRIGLINAEAQAKAQNPTLSDLILAQSLSGSIAGSGQSSIPQTPEEAKKQFIGTERGLTAEEVTTEPVYSTYKGQKRISGYQAKITPEAEAARKRGTTLQKEREALIEKENSFAQDKLDTIAEIRKGMNYFGLQGVIPAIPNTAKANWQANIDKLLSGEVLKTISELKKQNRTGATGLGALNIEELKVLKNASTALKKSLNKKDANRYLTQMENVYTKILNKNQSFLPSVQSDDFQSEIEAINQRLAEIGG